MKKILLFVCLVLVPALFVFGCSTVTETSTTTTSTSATTSTTLSGSASISGTITIPAGLSGTLWFGAHTSPAFPMDGEWIEDDAYIPAGQTTYNYTLPISSAGTYYVCAVLYVNITGTYGDPVDGDRAGQYLNGRLPAIWGQSPSGDPAAIVVGTSAVTGKNFSLLVTWVN